jgi:hypothetical protein
VKTQTSDKIAQEIIMVMRCQDKSSIVVDEHLNKLFEAYEIAIKKEKEFKTR